MRDNSNVRQNITALIYDKRGRVISVGKNSYVKTHPLQAKFARQHGESYKQFLHAEIHAITRCKDLSKAHRIFVVRYNKAGQPMLAKPCPICASAISEAGIRFVEHT
jgi:hypothetical protein